MITPQLKRNHWYLGKQPASSNRLWSRCYVAYIVTVWKQIELTRRESKSDFKFRSHKLSNLRSTDTPRAHKLSQVLSHVGSPKPDSDYKTFWPMYPRLTLLTIKGYICSGTVVGKAVRPRLSANERGFTDPALNPPQTHRVDLIISKDAWYLGVKIWMVTSKLSEQGGNSRWKRHVTADCAAQHKF